MNIPSKVILQKAQTIVTGNASISIPAETIGTILKENQLRLNVPAALVEFPQATLLVTMNNLERIWEEK